MHFLAYSSTGCALVGKCEPALDDIGCMTMHYILRILSRALGICLSKCLGQVKTHIHINLSVPVSLCLSTLYIFPLLWSHRVSSLPFASLRCASLLFSSFPSLPLSFCMSIPPCPSMWWLIKNPLSANGHSSRITMLLYLYLCISLSLYISLYLSLYLSISLSLYLSVSLSLHPSIHSSIHPTYLQ